MIGAEHEYQFRRECRDGRGACPEATLQFVMAGRRPRVAMQQRRMRNANQRRLVLAGDLTNTFLIEPEDDL